MGLCKTMRIALIGPGIMPIPNNGFGAVEKLVYSYYLNLQKLGYSVDIINTPNQEEIISLVNSGGYHIAHCHYDVFVDILPKLKVDRVCISSHYPYIDQVNKHAQDNYHHIFRKMIERSNDFPIFSVSEKDRLAFIHWGCPPSNIFMMSNGVEVSDFDFNETCENPDKTITLAQINARKRQHLTANISRVYYVGKGPWNHPNYLGELPDYWKYNCLTKFANMVLVSDGENGTPLCIREGLSAGLGIVITEQAASELDYSKSWISVISEQDAKNEQKLKEIIENNVLQSVGSRKEIREYAQRFDWSQLIPAYVENLKRILK